MPDSVTKELQERKKDKKEEKKEVVVEVAGVTEIVVPEFKTCDGENMTDKEMDACIDAQFASVEDDDQSQ